jgi:DNA (cytosine-5)-methyltransferase 1
MKRLRSVELFGGAGGLAMGLSAAGFNHDAVVERDADACATIRKNKTLGTEPMVSWPLYEVGVEDFDYSIIPAGLDVLAGGPPCQPFSIGGKHRALQDERNMFPEAVRAVRELKPRAFIFENVRGLMRESFSVYFEYIKLQLSYPTIARARDEDWRDHLARLQQHHTSSPHRGLRYNVVAGILNAVNFGIPQRRDRVFIVGFRSDLDVKWDLHRVSRKERPQPNEKLSRRIDELRWRLLPLRGERWQTVRDAIADLPDPASKEVSSVLNHKYIPGARAYTGHTGSPLDEPAKTLKAGDHGVPGGENMLALPSGEVRYFTVRESARLQTFPDQIFFPGSWTETMRQLGNAVPMQLGKVMASAVHRKLESLTP